MAYACGITTRARLFARRSQPFVHYIHRNNDQRQQSTDGYSSHQKINCFTQHRFSGNRRSFGFGSFYQEKRCLPFSFFPRVGFAPCRYMSTVTGEESEKITHIGDVAKALSDATVDAVSSQAPALSEVSIAAADSKLPVAALQHVIDCVHSLTGFNWWASIVMTTLLIRAVTVPLLINQLKTTAKLSKLTPELMKVKKEINDAGGGQIAQAEGHKKMMAIYKKHGVHPLSPLKGLIIQTPIFLSFYFAITNMVEKVPSFKVGGAFWFTDLTTPDGLYILPVLTGLCLLIMAECNVQEGLQGSHMARKIKNFSRGLAVFTVFVTTSFPKGILCYWITSNLFSLVFGLVTKRPAIRGYLGVPLMEKAPPSTALDTQFSWGDFITKMRAGATSRSSDVQVKSSRPVKDRNFSFSALIQRMKATVTSRPALVQVKAPQPVLTSSSAPEIHRKIKKIERQMQRRKKGKKW